MLEDELDDDEAEDEDEEAELFESSPPHAAMSVVSAAAPPAPPIILRNFFREASSRASSSSAPSRDTSGPASVVMWMTSRSVAYLTTSFAPPVRVDQGPPQARRVATPGFGAENEKGPATSRPSLSSWCGSALLDLDARAGLLELALELVGLVAVDALLDGL